MKRISYLAATGVAVATAIAAQVSGSAPAFAGGNGAATQYTAGPYSEDFSSLPVAEDYTGPVNLGNWTCSGVRVANSHFVRDNFTCTTDATDVTATFSGTQEWPCGCYGWTSDFDGQVTNDYEIDISNGTVTGWAIYSQGA